MRSQGRFPRAASSSSPANKTLTSPHMAFRYCLGSTFISTGITVPLNLAIVKPYLSKTRGSHCSEKRSSVSMGIRSATEPPKMVSIVDELDMASQCSLSSAVQDGHILRATKHVVEEAFRVVFVCASSVGSSLRQCSRKICLGEQRRAIGLSTRVRD